jgi:hypothetical protein
MSYQGWDGSNVCVIVRELVDDIVYAHIFHMLCVFISVVGPLKLGLRSFALCSTHLFNAVFWSL